MGGATFPNSVIPWPTSRHRCLFARTSADTPSSSSRVDRSGAVLSAAEMVFRSFARMMHPPRQMRASSDSRTPH
eukprot:3181872-Pyramimonas_sp.AAC.1